MDAHVGEILDAIDELQHPRQHHRRVHERQRPGPDLARGKAPRGRGAATTSRTWKARCGRRSSSAGPARIPAGRVSNEIVHEVDTFTTFARIAGAQVPQDRPIDGVDQTRFSARQVREVQPRGLPGVRRRPPGGGEVAELEGGLLRRAAGLVDAARQARHAARSSTSSPTQGGVPATASPNSWVAGPAMKIARGVRAEPEATPADRAGHARPVHATEIRESDDMHSGARAFVGATLFLIALSLPHSVIYGQEPKSSPTSAPTNLMIFGRGNR